MAAKKKAVKKKASRRAASKAAPQAPDVTYFLYNHKGEVAGQYDTPEEAITDAVGPRYRNEKSKPSFTVVPFVNGAKLHKKLLRSGSPGLEAIDVVNDAQVKIDEALKRWRKEGLV